MVEKDQFMDGENNFIWSGMGDEKRSWNLKYREEVDGKKLGRSGMFLGEMDGFFL